MQEYILLKFIRIKILLALACSAISQFGLATGSQNKTKDSVILSLLGKSIAQFASLSVATARDDSLPTNRNLSETLLDHTAMKIFDLYLQSLEAVKDRKVQDLILTGDDMAFDFIANHKAIKSRESVLKYLANNDQAQYIKDRQTFVNELKIVIKKVLDESELNDREWQKAEVFRSTLSKIKGDLESWKAQISDADTGYVDLVLIDEYLKQISTFESPPIYEKYLSLGKTYWKKNKKNILGGAKFGAVAAIPIWTLLVVKNYFLAGINPTPASLPITIGFSTAMFALMGAGTGLDYSILLQRESYLRSR